MLFSQVVVHVMCILVNSIDACMDANGDCINNANIFCEWVHLTTRLWQALVASLSCLGHDVNVPVPGGHCCSRTCVHV
jgi:hypothetical protein